MRIRKSQHCIKLVLRTRKTDPGPCFDWNRYARMAAWPSAALPDDVA